MKRALLAFLLAARLAAAAPAGHCIVIDPGHGGARDVDESSANNATSPAGVKEKDLTLEMSRAVFTAIRDSERAKKARIEAVLTRDADENIGMSERARLALAHRADVLVSIHFNASANHAARGPLGMVQDAAHGNKNVARDGAFADRLAGAVAAVTQHYDSRSAPRGFLTDRELKDGRGSFLLRHLRAEPRGQEIRACFLEIEFIDNPEVEAWLILGEKARAVRAEIAAAIANELIACVSPDRD